MKKLGDPARRPDRIGFYFRQERWPLLLVTASGILYNVGMAAGPWFEGQLAQRLSDIIGGSRAAGDMLPLAAAYAAVMLFVQAMRFLKRFYVRRFANNVNRSMKRVLYNGLVHKSRAALARESVGGLMTRAISDVDACAEGMRKFTTEIFDTGVVLVAYLAMLFYYDWRLALLSGVFPPLAYLIAEKLRTAVHRSAAASRESAGQLSGATLDRVSGALTYRVFGCERGRDRDYDARLADYERAAVRANIWVTALQPLYQVLSMAGVLFVVWFGARNVLGTGWARWDIAAFATFLSCFTRLAVKSSKAAKLFNAVQKAQVSWRRVKPLLRAPEEEADASAAPPAALTVEGLSFAYPDGPELLHGVSFSVRPGQILGVTGPVACGKSTLGKVFLCEYPYAGSVRFGGRELSSLSPAERAAVVVYMGHQPELMSDTVENNILLGADGDARGWLRAVCLEKEVGPQTVVGSGGVRLSGGQQARVALARTLCGKRPVIVLDDPFSAVDRATERSLFESLRRLAPDSAVLLISHRLDLFPELDGVLWLEGGAATAGSHARLMETVPEYARLYRAQTEGGDGHEE